MKKVITIILVLIALLAIATPAFAIKPNGAEFYGWHLSADVMPSGLCGAYGKGDIPGSDDASKLIVNQPNGNTEVTITGVMHGLNPYTEYTVFLGQGYSPYIFLGYSIVGTWEFRYHLNSSIYEHDVVFSSQAGGVLTGTGGYPASDEPPYAYPYNETITGSINPMLGEFSFRTNYENSYYADISGSVAADGTLSGTWLDSNSKGGSWESYVGKATCLYTGDTWFKGHKDSTPELTFMTDEYGSGSWHLNLRDGDFSGAGEYTLSIWVNGGGRTVLISDNFTVSVD